MIATSALRFFGSVSLYRTSDEASIGNLTFRENVIEGVRYKGLFGPAERRPFDTTEKAAAWIAESRNIPEFPAFALEQAHEKVGRTILRLFDLPDGRFIGACKFASMPPAVYPIQNGKAAVEMPMIKRTRGSWSVYKNRVFKGRRNMLENAIPLLAKIAAPSNGSGHEQLAWREVLANIETSMKRDGLPFDPNIFEASKSGA